ncbi:MAG: FAD-dependent oxidoreductase [Armatimonadetes bacterium]|nr:FAD-dependent oxidoreductase [Armatimonadota bacterium]
MDPYVIVGNGVAAINAVEAIRATGDSTPIMILTDQECAFYSRPCLYYIMLGRIEWEDAWGRPQSWYEEYGVELNCNTAVTAVDPDAHTVRVEDKTDISYSKLLLATGTRARMLPWADQHLRGIVTLNTLLDVVAITSILGSANHAVIAGGGLTSIELVETCRHWGVHTTFVMRGSRFLDKQLTDDEAELIHARLRAGGVDVRTHEEIAEVSGRYGRVQRATLKNSGEELYCGVAGNTVGVIPNKELVEEVGAETDRGIVTDDHMRTTLPDVYAAGDVVQVRGCDGRPGRAELLWYVAADMGTIAGRNMAGEDAVYQRRVFLNVSEFCGLDFCGVGSIVPGQEGVEETIIKDDGKGSIRFVTRASVLIGTCFLGDIRLADICRGLVATGTRLAELHPDHPVRHVLDRGSP